MKYAIWLLVGPCVVGLGAWRYYFRPWEQDPLPATAAAPLLSIAREAPAVTERAALTRVDRETPRPAAAPDPLPLADLPVVVGRWPSAIGRGVVGQVRNTGDKYLRLAATYKNVTTGRTTSVVVEVGPNATVELGWVEGCPLAAGDVLTLSHPNYKTRSWEF